jgi:hypothetical protein
MMLLSEAGGATRKTIAPLTEQVAQIGAVADMIGETEDGSG